MSQATLVRPGIYTLETDALSWGWCNSVDLTTAVNNLLGGGSTASEILTAYAALSKDRDKAVLAIVDSEGFHHLACGDGKFNPDGKWKPLSTFRPAGGWGECFVPAGFVANVLRAVKCGAWRVEAVYQGDNYESPSWDLAADGSGNNWPVRGFDRAGRPLAPSDPRETARYSHRWEPVE